MASSPPSRKKRKGKGQTHIERRHDFAPEKYLVAPSSVCAVHSAEHPPLLFLLLLLLLLLLSSSHQ